ncbi:MAG: hypothetical protein GY861_13500 [bacterium]|nr:hypothetical protein [bacterium]
MKSILLPKEVKMLPGDNGEAVLYDIPTLVFSQGQQNVPEQISSALYYCLNEDFVNAPYPVQVVHQPLVNLYAYQSALKAVLETPRSSLESKENFWDHLATFFASEDVLVAPPERENELVSEAIEKFEDGKAQLSGLEQICQPFDEQTHNMMNQTREAIVELTGLKVPEAVSFLKQYLQEFKKNGNAKFAEYQDEQRRIVVGSLQSGEREFLTCLDKLVENFNDRPTLRNARLMDVFSRQYINLGFERFADSYLDIARDSYRELLGKIVNRRQSAYASLILLDLVQGDHDSAKRDFKDMKNTNRTDPAKVELVKKAISRISSTSRIPVNAINEQKNDAHRLQKEYHPVVLNIIDERIDEYIGMREECIQGTSRLDALRSLIDYSRSTCLVGVVYESSDNTTFRNIVFNQKPPFKFKDEVESAPHKENGNTWWKVSQNVGENYFGNLDKVMFGKNLYTRGRLFGEPAVDSLVDSPVDDHIMNAVYIPDTHLSLTLSPEAHASKNVPLNPNLKLNGGSPK